MDVLAYAGIVLLVVIAVVLFVAVPAIAIHKAWPEICRMWRAPRVPPEDAPINTARAITRALDRADAHRVPPARSIHASTSRSD